MQVETVGVAGRSSDLQPGQCFLFDNDGRAVLGIFTKDEFGHTAAFVFSADQTGRLPSVQKGLPSTVLIVRDALIRTDPTSLAFTNDIPIGSVISAGTNSYIAAGMHRVDCITMNLATGLTEDIPAAGKYVSFGRWSAGIVRGDRWVTLFEFPSSQ